jgi:mRNA interferase RelE/StbE
LAYTVIIQPSAKRALKKIPQPERGRIGKRIDELETNPRLRGSEPFEGIRGGRRLRVGDYRIVYAIEDEVLKILIIRVGHRRELYRKQDRWK